MDDRKRPPSPSSHRPPTSTGGPIREDPSSLQSPPMKKQATMKRHVVSNGSSPLPPSAAVAAISHTTYPASCPTDLSDESIQAFQKEAIWRQLEEYKRVIARLESSLHQSQVREDRIKEAVGSLDVSWEVVEGGLELAQSRLGGDKPVSTPIQADPSSSATPSLLSTLLAFTSSPELTVKESLEGTIGVKAQSLRHILQRILSRIQLLETAGSLPGVSPTSSALGPDKSEELRVRCAEWSRRARIAEVEADLAKAKAKEEAGKVDALTENLSRAERLVDRLKLQLTRASQQPPPTSSSSLPPPSSLSATSPTPASGTDMERSISSRSKDSEYAADKEKLEGTIEELKQLANGRLNEITGLREEKVQLEISLDAMRIQASEVPEARVLTSGSYKSLLAECTHLREEVDRLRDSADSLRSERDDLRASRHTLTTLLEAEEEERRGVLQAEVRRLEGDLARVRGNRDHLQQQLDVRYARDTAELAQNQEIRRLANTRKDRLIAMTLEVRRLRMQRAAKAGDAGAVKYYAEEAPHPGQEGTTTTTASTTTTTTKGDTKEDAKGDAPVDGEEGLNVEVERERRERLLETRLKEALKEAEEGKAQLRTWATASQSVRQTQELLEAQGRLALEVEELQGRIRGMERIYGLSSSQDQGGEGTDDASDDPVSVGKRLQAALEARDKLIKELEERCAFASQMEAHLAGEVEALGAAWKNLEEQSGQKVLDLAAKEDQVVGLLAEKAKQEQKCSLLLRHKDTAANVAVALRRQHEREVEERRRLEGEGGALRKQLALLERESLSSAGQAAQWRRELLGAKALERQVGERAKATEARVAEAQRVAAERVRTAEEALHSRRRMTEEAAEWRRKWEEMKGRANGPGGGGAGGGPLSGGPSDASGDHHHHHPHSADASESAQMIEEYKRLLKCASCHNRFKSHVILRCMHVFCKECIDLRLGTRQRKCPTCSESFGAGDVKQVYL